MEKRNVLVTGANGGIGISIVNEYLSNGHRVIAHYHRSNKNLIKIKNENLTSIQADFSSLEQVNGLIEKCGENEINIDILINNAGTYMNACEIEDITQKDFDNMLMVNLKSPFRLSQLVFKSMKSKKWGRIVNVSSIGVKYGGSPKTAAYTISKAGLEALTYSFAKAGALYNILVNTVRVGVTDTEFHKSNKDKNLEDRIKMIPLKRNAMPEEIAKTIYFLTSDSSSFTTGSIVTVAGGE